MSKFFTYLYIAAITLLISACSSSQSKVDSQTDSQQLDSLYQDIGGQEGIETLVNTFVKHIARDKDIMPYFAKSSVSHFKKGFSQHLCDAINGPCQYEGDSMVDIHTGMNISEKDFNRVVELLIAAMEEAGINYPSQNKILKLLARERGDIIKI